VRYYFDIKNSHTVIEANGGEYPTQGDARAHAKEVAKKRACKNPDDDLKDAFVSVTDEKGSEIFRAR
jgi:Domain of unknown function (DUF6894)